MDSMHNARTAATRLTRDSAASESRPTEPVTCQAMTFIVIVTTAAAMDSQANRVRLDLFATTPTSILQLRPYADQSRVIIQSRSTPQRRVRRRGARSS